MHLESSLQGIHPQGKDGASGLVRPGKGRQSQLFGTTGTLFLGLGPGQVVC
jgi:hypothetical protein